MSYNQENLIDDEINKMKRSFPAKTQNDNILKFISPAKSKFFMPKPRISSHSKCEPFVEVKSIVDMKNCPLPRNMVAEGIGLSRNNKQQADEDTENLRLEKDTNNLDTCNNMLAVTISCVMLMASNVSTISEEYLSWAENYLSQIKDKNGDNPPNIQGILNHIKYLRLRPVIIPENLPPVNKIKFSSRFSDIRSCSNSSCSQIKLKQMEKRVNTNSSIAGETLHRKRNVLRTNSCATIPGLSQPIQKNK